MGRRKRRARKPQQNRSHRIASSGRASAKSFPSPVNYYGFALVLALGIILRLFVFTQMGYLNNDNHLEVIAYVADHSIPARADQFNQAYHPPLYYFLAAPLLRLGNIQAVHGLSLLSSIATLLLIACLLRRLPWINQEIQLWCLGLAAFHPQFMMFTLFVSNDTLAILLGVLIFYQCRRVQENSSRFNFCLLGAWLGLGLLTKAVFLTFVFPLILFIWMTGRQHALPDRQLISGLVLFILITGLLGCYKFVENSIYFGNPVVSNLDIWNWARDQQPTWIGSHSLFDFNLLKLVRHPVISTSTVHSYPLMIYGSFWYSFIPESTFRSNLLTPFNRLGSTIYLVALCPTLLMLVGATRMAMAAIRFGSSAMPEPGVYTRDRFIYEGSLLLTLLVNFFLILAVGWRYDVWSVFQGRLLFPSYFALLLAFSVGMEWAESSPLLTHVTRCLMIALIALFLAYLIVDVWLAILYPVNPLRTHHLPYEIDMNGR
jgi:dolichyl-phosphate-mannose-protein mannosyltransferase